MGCTVHWFVLASQKEARIFVKTTDRKKIKLLKTLPHPLGREKKSALIRKEAGRGVKSMGRLTSIYYSEPKRHDPHEEAVMQFAKEICQFLKNEKYKKNFDSLTVVAEARLMGKIKAEMKSDLLKAVTNWIKKDLQKIPLKELVDFLLPKNEKY